MADTEARGIAPPQRQDVSVPGLGFASAPGVSARPSPVALPGVPTPDTSASQSLIRALGISGNNLDAVDQAYLKEQREEEFKKGQMAKDQYKSKEEFAKAQADGLIPQGANPWFIKGVENQQGTIDAIARNERMQQAYDQSPAKGNDDPAVMEKFRADFAKADKEAHPGGSSTDWWDGYNKTALAGDETLSHQHVADVHDALVAKQVANTGAEANVILNSTSDVKIAAAGIEALREKQRLAGMAPQDFDKTIAAAINAKARLGNGSFLSLLDEIKTSDGKAVLTSNPQVALMKADTTAFLTNQARSAQQFAWAAKREAYWENVVVPAAEEDRKYKVLERERQGKMWDRDEQSRSLMTTIQLATMAHPETAYADTQDDMKKLATVDPMRLDTMKNFIQSYVANTNDVPVAAEAPVANDFRERMIRASGDGTAQQQLQLEMMTAVKDHRLNVRTYNQLYMDSRQAATWDPDYSRKINSPELNSFKEGLKAIFSNATSNGMAVLTGKAASDYLVAVDVINHAAQDFLKAHPSATAQEVREAGEKAWQTIQPTLMPQATSTLTELGQNAEKGAALPAYPAAPPKAPLPKGQTAPPPTQMETNLGKFSAESKMALLKEAAQAHRKGPQAFMQFLAEHDQALGIAGITAAIINEANTRATATPPVKN
jgi:hypothetical protein